MNNSQMHWQSQISNLSDEIISYMSFHAWYNVLLIQNNFNNKAKHNEAYYFMKTHFVTNSVYVIVYIHSASLF